MPDIDINTDDNNEIEINLEISPEINNELEIEALYGPKGDKGDTGPQGPQGIQGIQGPQGDDGYSPTASVEQTETGATITITDINGTTTATVLNGTDGQDGADGADGADGQDGADGFSPIATVTKSGDTATISITDANGTTTATVSDGADGTNGQDGQDGQDGYSPTATVVKSGNTATITITDKNGTTTAQISDAVGSITDVQQNGVSVVSSGIANVIVPDAQIQSDWSQTDNTKKDYIKNKPTIPTVPTALSSFTDDLGSSPTHTHSQYVTDVSGKLNKSGDTMTGQLAFDKSLNGYTTININDIPLKTQMDCITDGNHLPTGNIYGNGKVCVDNNGDFCYREYDRWSATGQYLKQWQVTCKNANNVAQYARLGLSVNTAGRTTFEFPMCDTKPTTTSTAASNKVIVATNNYLNGEAGYIKYSDGMILQWSKTANGATSITLLQSYTSTNYAVFTSQYFNVASNSCGNITGKTKTGFTVIGYTSMSFNWFAIGY